MPKIVKIPLKILVVLLGLLIITLVIFQTSWFKNYAADKATEYLSSELGTDVSIGEITLDYFERLVVTNLYIADQNSDTLIYIEELKVNYDLFSFSSSLIQFDEVSINNASIYIGIPKDSNILNIQYLINYFTPPRSGKKGSSQTISFDKVEITNTSFHYFNKNSSPPNDRAFDENNMFFSNLNGHLHDFKIINDSLNFILENISGTEKSGLIIDELTAHTIISPSTMRFDKLRIKTPKSHIEDFLEFRYKSYADFSDFIKVVKVKFNFTDAVVHTDDLALFSSSLKSYDELLSATGTIDGTIANLRSREIQLSVGSHTKFAGSARLIGLPDIYSTQFDINARSITSNANDLVELLKLEQPPQEFLRLGKISYTGTFKGLISDFDIAARISSNIGNIETRLHYKQLDNTVAYNGNIKSDDFNLKELLNQNKLGSTSFDLDLDGQGLTLESLSTSLNGHIGHIDYNNYDYKNLDINGDVKNQVFTGNFNIVDPNFDLVFDGNFDLSSDQPKIAINTNVRSVNLKTLGLDSIDNIVSFNGDVQLEGKTIDDITGEISLDSFTIVRDTRNYKLKNVKINANSKDSNKHYSLSSDLINVDLNGQFKLSELGSLITYIEHTVSPDQFQIPVDSIESQNISLTLEINEYQSLFKEILGDILFDSAFLNFKYNHATRKIEGTSHISAFKYDMMSTPYIDVLVKNGGRLTPVNFAINTGGLLQNDSVLFDKLNANGFINDGIVHFETTSQRDSLLDIILAGKLTLQNDSVQVFFENSKVDIYNKPWILRKTKFPNIVYSKGITEFRYFDFRNSEEILFIDASVGENANKINVILTDFKLENLTPFIAGFDIKLQGITNGYIDVSDREGFPIIEADLTVDDLQLDDDTLGTLILNSISKDDLLAVAIDGSITGGLLNDMKILGDIDFTDQVSPLNLKLSTEHSSIKPFEKFLQGLASNVTGFSTTDIKITGPLTSPQLHGIMELDSLDFLVDYLQTKYQGQATISIDYNSFEITRATLYDRFGQQGQVKGSVSHSNFKDFKFNINIDNLDNFEIMNTSRNDNELFYGTAFVDGNMRVLGPMDDILLQINAKSRKGTQIKIPLDNAEAGGKLSYVEFVNLKLDNNQLNKSFKSTAGVRMDFNFEITNDASITLIFDELLGDKIEAAGHGNLRMEINTYGDFNMYGGLTIDRGSYLFTALDLINKYFTVKQGGTLFWDGNPYNAKINLEAIKREYPIPLSLVKGSVTEAEESLYEAAIPVDCYLKLTGLLFNPEVSFDLDFPSQSSLGGNANSSLNTVIERVKLDPEEVNRQVFALLVLGTFIPPSFSSGSVENPMANTGLNSLSDFASSQLNNWLGQLDTRFQVGVDYQNSYESNAELIVTLRRKFLDDRLEVSGSVDAVAQGSRPYDISIKYDINEDGNLKIRGFQKQANDPTLGNINNVTTTGVGLFYRYQFDKFRIRKKKIKPE